MAGEQPATPESQSIEDRLYAQFEPEQPQEQTPEQPEPQQETAGEESEQAQSEFVEAEFNGKTYQVPPELKDALMAQSDYTRKTTEVSERQKALDQKELQYKAVESERRFHEAVKEDIGQMQEIDFSIKQWKAIDVTQMTSEQLWQVKTQIDNLKDKREELARGVNSKWNAWQQEQIGIAHEIQAKAQDLVSKSIKGWGPEIQRALTDYGNAEGYTNEELKQLSHDARIVKTLWKAQQFDKLQAQKLEGKVRSLPTVKPGSSNPMPQQVKDKLSLSKQMNKATTSAQKAKVIEQEMMRRF